MASCSLYTPASSPLLTRAELQSIILFERVVGDWVREVHIYTSKSKHGSNYVIFRNSDNTKLKGTQAFQSYLSRNGYDVSFLETAVFKSDKVGKVVSNKVGANVIARKEALHWIEDVKNNKIGKLGKLNLTKSKTEFTKKTEKTQSNKKKTKQLSKENELPVDLQKEINNALAQFDKNNDAFWMGDKLDMLIDAEISEEEDKTVDHSKSIAKENPKKDKAQKLELGSIDYSWMDSFGCDSDGEGEHLISEVIGEDNDNTLDLGPIDYSWMESLADDSESVSHLAKDSVGKRSDQFKFDSLDYSWMDSMGGASDIEEDNLNLDEENEKDNIQTDGMAAKNVFVENEDKRFNEKTKAIFEDIGRRQKENGEMLDVGHFCAAWMDCFESITELDNNLKVRLEGTDCRSVETDQVSSSLLLNKSTKDYLNHKIAEGLGDYSSKAIQEKENEMFKLLEEVLLRPDHGLSEDAIMFAKKVNGMKAHQIHKSLECKEGYLETKESDADFVTKVPSVHIPEEINCEETSKATWYSEEEKLREAAIYFNGLEISPNKSTQRKNETEKISSCELATPSLELADSDSSYFEEAENTSALGLKKKRREKSGRSLKRKFKKDKKILNKMNSVKLGANKTLNLTDKNTLKSEVNNLLGKQAVEGSRSPAQYSSDWETDEEDIDKQSSDEMEDM